jgi:hypothetical protein
MIRLAQNMTFLAMLERKPQDVQMIRKSMTRLVLPLPDSNNVNSAPLQLKDYVPRRTFAERERMDPFTSDAGLRGLSLMLSRSYLLLIAQIFRSMPRHSNDRNEMVVLVDGLNRILLIHGDDIGIVSHVMVGESDQFDDSEMSIYDVLSINGCQHSLSTIVYLGRRLHVVHAYGLQSLCGVRAT